jgi:hypothetical protein
MGHGLKEQSSEVLSANPVHTANPMSSEHVSCLRFSRSGMGGSVASMASSKIAEAISNAGGTHAGHVRYQLIDLPVAATLLTIAGFHRQRNAAPKAWSTLTGPRNCPRGRKKGPSAM